MEEGLEQLLFLKGELSMKVEKINEQIRKENEAIAKLYSQIWEHQEAIARLESERESIVLSVLPDDETSFIDNWLNEHFGISSQKEARSKSIFIVFDKTANFVRTVLTGLGTEFRYASPSEDETTLDHWLKKNKLYAHSASSFCGRNRVWYDWSLKAQLENLGWEFDEAGQLTNTAW